VNDGEDAGGGSLGAHHLVERREEVESLPEELAEPRRLLDDHDAPAEKGAVDPEVLGGALW
jgi:hypothetical protein